MATQRCLKNAGIARFRFESAGRIRSAHAGAERRARGGTPIRQSVGDEPHPAETAAATGRSIAGQDALRHEANGQGGIGTLTYKWASACATRFGHESYARQLTGIGIAI